MEQPIMRMNRLYATLIRISETMIRFHDEDALFREICDILAGENRVPLVWIGLLEGNMLVKAAAAGSPTPGPDAFAIDIDGPLGKGPTGTALREGRLMMMKDLESLPPFWDNPQPRSLKAAVALPLRQRGKIRGSMTVYAESASFFDAEQIRLLDMIGENISHTLDGLHQERQRAETELHLRRTAAELARSNEDLEQFAYVASHDLQEPLRMITAFAGLLRDRYLHRMDETADDYLAYMISGATRMQDLINSLLSYSKVNGDARTHAPIALQDSLNSALQNLKSLIESTSATITCAHLPTLNADSLHLSQVFQNLIGNALKYRNPNAKPEIHIGAEKVADPLWLFYVRDNGIGIDPHYSQKIFEIFQRLHANDRYGGTGIGLAICKKIVEGYGGKIWVESVPGKGSTFFFTLSEKTK